MRSSTIQHGWRHWYACRRATRLAACMVITIYSPDEEHYPLPCIATGGRVGFLPRLTRQLAILLADEHADLLGEVEQTLPLLGVEGDGHAL